MKSRMQSGGIEFTWDDRRLRNSLLDFSDELKVDIKKVFRRHVRLWLVRVQQWTPPIPGNRGNSTGKAKKVGEHRVRQDILRAIEVVRPEKIRNARLRELAEQRDYAGFNDAALRMGFFKVHSPLQAFSPALHDNARVRGVVPKTVVPSRILAVEEPALAKHIKLMQSHVGRAKAGWQPAIEAMDFKGQQRTQKWITRHKNFGKVDVNEYGPMSMDVVIANNAESVRSAAASILESSAKAQIRALEKELVLALKNAAKKAKLQTDLG